MKTRSLFCSATVVLLCACGSNGTTTTSEQNVPAADNIIADSVKAVDAPVANNQPEKIVIREVLDLLVKEKDKDMLKSSLCDYEKNGGTYNSNVIGVDHDIYGPDQEYAGCNGMWDIACLKKTDGSYLVLYLYNYGCEGEPTITEEFQAYVYDGNKLTKSNFQLPKHKYSDCCDDGLVYFGLKPEIVDKIKTETIDNVTRYDSYGEEGSVKFSYLQVYSFIETGNGNLSFKRNYAWNGNEFVPDNKTTTDLMDSYGVGNLKIGITYTGQPVEGYEVVKNNDSCYDLKKNGELCLRIGTNSSNRILWIDVFSPKYTDYGFGLGVNLADFLKENAREMTNETGIVSFRYMGLNCAFYYKDIKECNEADDGTLTNVVLNEGAKLNCITIGEH